MTGNGKTVFEAAMKRQSPWANALVDGLSAVDVEITSRVLKAIRDKLQAQNDLQPKERDNVEEFV
jgi:hypothetical protein